MIEVLIDLSCLKKLKKELALAGSREIGGVLAAENLGNGQFRVVDISVQRTGGSYAHFVRDPKLHRRFMRRFFARTGNRPERFNYLGEWHSHPSFRPLPSFTDLNQMQQLIEERDQVANFLILLIVKLGNVGTIEASTHAFRPKHMPLPVPVLPTTPSKLEDRGMQTRKIFSRLISSHPASPDFIQIRE